MDKEVILNIDGGHYLLSISEALQVAEILCSCSRPGKKWQAGGVKDLRVMLPPDAQAATITPYTVLMKLDHEANAKEVT